MSTHSCMFSSSPSPFAVFKLMRECGALAGLADGEQPAVTGPGLR
jgi:hypothetical protein